MADKKIKEGMLSAMTSRQKVMAVILVIVLLIILWNVIGIFSNGSGSAAPAIVPVNKAPGKMTAAAPNGVAPGPAGSMAPSAPGVVAPAAPSAPSASIAPVVAPEQPQLRETMSTMNNQLLELQKETQQKYLDQLNQLQLLKIQREIAETNQAIANARLATVTAEKNVSDLLTRPSAGQPQPPVFPTTLTPPGTPPTGQESIPLPPPTAETTYTVISVAMQLGRWSAVLGYEGKLFNVSIGDVLPVDGSKVAEIDKNGVVLQEKDGKRRRFNIVSSL